MIHQSHAQHKLSVKIPSFGFADHTPASRQCAQFSRCRAALLSLGVRPRLANNTAGSGRGTWYLARANALSVGLSNAYLKSLGLPTLIDGC